MNSKEKLLRDYGRMCLELNCKDCRIGEDGGSYVGCQRWIFEHPKEATEIIEEWATEHPINTNTRQDLFLKQFPNVGLDEENIINMSPCVLDKDMFHNCKSTNCEICRKEYWKQEVGEWNTERTQS